MGVRLDRIITLLLKDGTWNQHEARRLAMSVPKLLGYYSMQHAGVAATPVAFMLRGMMPRHEVTTENLSLRKDTFYTITPSTALSEPA